MVAINLGALGILRRQIVFLVGIIGDIEDLIINEYNLVTGVVMGTGGFLGIAEKKVGVNVQALKFAEKDGKSEISLPEATPEVLAAVQAYERTTPKKSLVERAMEKTQELTDKATATAKSAAEGAKPALEDAAEKTKDAYEKAKEAAKPALDNALEKTKEAYEKAGIGPNDVSLVELHDCFATAEILHYENLGLCAEGEAGRMVDEGATSIGGKVPVNASGGLLSKGHPLGATGVANVCEVVWHLRGEAGNRQVEGAKVGLAHVIGLGSACTIQVLEKV